jgi:hypothetical protein
MYSTINGSCTGPLNMAAKKDSIIKATEHLINDTIVVDGVRDTIDESPNSDATANALAEVIQEPVINATSTGMSTNSHPFNKPLSNSPTAEITAEMTAASAKDHTNAETALYTVGEDTPISEPSITNCTETTTVSLASPSDVASIPGRNLIFRIFGRRGCVVFVRFVVACFLVDNLDVSAFKAYCSVFGIWGETMSGNVLFFFPSKSFVTSLNRHKLAISILKGIK